MEPAHEKNHEGERGESANEFENECARAETSEATGSPRFRFQFTLASLCLFTTFCAILMSIISVGYISAESKVAIDVVTVARNHPYSGSDREVTDAQIVRYELFQGLLKSPQVVDLAARLLRRRGVKSFNGRAISGPVLQEQIAIKASRWKDLQLVASSRDVDSAKAVLKAVCDAYMQVLPKERERLEDEFFERMKAIESQQPADWQSFVAGRQQGWSECFYAGNPTNAIWWQDTMYLGPVYVISEHPFLPLCLFAGGAWITLGFAVVAWRMVFVRRKESLSFQPGA